MSTPRRRRKDREPVNQTVSTPAAVPTATGEVANRLESLASEPTHDEIAQRAYQLYQARGSEHGRDRDDWFHAERELRNIALGEDEVGRLLAGTGSYAAA
jgi:hypothetical protein